MLFLARERWLMLKTFAQVTLSSLKRVFEWQCNTLKLLQTRLRFCIILNYDVVGVHQPIGLTHIYIGIGM